MCVLRDDIFSPPFTLFKSKLIFLCRDVWAIAEFKEVEPRFKLETRLNHDWFHFKLYSVFRDLSRQSIATGFRRFSDALKFLKFLLLLLEKVYLTLGKDGWAGPPAAGGGLLGTGTCSISIPSSSSSSSSIKVNIWHKNKIKQFFLILMKCLYIEGLYKHFASFHLVISSAGTCSSSMPPFFFEFFMTFLLDSNNSKI